MNLISTFLLLVATCSTASAAGRASLCRSGGVPEISGSFFGTQAEAVDFLVGTGEEASTVTTSPKEYRFVYPFSETPEEDCEKCSDNRFVGMKIYTLDDVKQSKWYCTKNNPSWIQVRRGVMEMQCVQVYKVTDANPKDEPDPITIIVFAEINRKTCKAEGRISVTSTTTYQPVLNADGTLTTNPPGVGYFDGEYTPNPDARGA